MGWFNREQKARPKAAGLPLFLGAFSPKERYFTNGKGHTFSSAYADIHFVYGIVTDIAAAGALLPLKFYLPQDDGPPKELRRDPGFQLIRRPNPTMTRNLLVSGAIGDLALHGNAFWMKVRSQLGGPPIELWPLRPERMTPIPAKSDGSLVGWEIFTGGAKPEEIPATEIIHFRTWNPLNEYMGLAPVQAMRYEIELGRSAEEAATDLWANSAQFNMAIKTADAISDEAIERLGEEFRAKFTGRGKRYKIPFLEQGMDIVPMSLNPQEAEFINTARMSRERVASGYGYPLPEQYQQVTPEEIRRAVFANALPRWTDIIQDTLDLSLVPEFDQDEVEPRFDWDAVLKPDLPSLAKAYKDLVYSGILAPEHAARLQNFPTNLPRFIPMNMNEVDEDGNVIVAMRPTNAQDSTGGQGGDEGRGGPETTQGGSRSRTPTEAKAISRLATDLMKVQERVRDGATKALEDRVRGVLNREEGKVKTVFGFKAYLQDQKDAVDRRVALDDIFDEGDKEIALLIQEALRTAADKAAEGTGKILEIPTINTEIISDRILENAPKALKYIRGDDLESLAGLLRKVATGELDQRGAQVAIEQTFGTSAARAEGVARTEVAKAASLATNQAYLQAGIKTTSWVTGTGPCKTGICGDLNGVTIGIGEDFDPGVPYPPAHPSCTCFTVPGDIALTGEG